MALDVNFREELVIDPSKNKERYFKWNNKIPDISQANEKAIVSYLEDIRRGINTNPKASKGKRGFSRLNSQRHRLKRISEFLESQFGISNIAPCKPDKIENLRKAVFDLFDQMEEGLLTKRSGGKYRAVKDYVKGFKAFWHWHMVAARNNDNLFLPDICEYLTFKENRKPRFVYFGDSSGLTTEDGFKKLYNHAKHNYKVIMAFLFDSGIRCPTELLNIKKKDLIEVKGSPHMILHIRDETTKTFGRKIKLMLCNDILREHIEENGFDETDFIFDFDQRVANQYLKRLGERVLGKKGITMYDFRHNSACYWAPRYKNPNALLYRFGWKRLEMLHYYTDFLGMKDTIEEDDLILDQGIKARIETNFNKEESRLGLMEDQLQYLKEQVEASKRKDAFLDKLISGLVEKGLGGEIAELIESNGMKNDLLKLKDEPEVSLSFQVDGQC